MKRISPTLIIWIVLFLVASASLKLYFSEKATSRRYFDDLQATQAKVKEFTTSDGHLATKTAAFELTNTDLRKAFPEVAQQLKNLDIRPRLAESYTQASTALNFEVSAPTRDTLISPKENRFTNLDPLKMIEAKTFHYSDKWKSVSGLVFPDTTFVKVAAVDSIFTAIYQGQRRHPWAWILSKRKLEVAATNRNPDIKITVIQAAMIKK